MNPLITETIQGEPYHYYPIGKYIVRAVGVCGERPTFKYTRIEISGVLERLTTGEHIDSIVQGYRERISQDAVNEAIRLVTSHFIETLPVLEAA